MPKEQFLQSLEDGVVTTVREEEDMEPNHVEENTILVSKATLKALISNYQSPPYDDLKKDALDSIRRASSKHELRKALQYYYEIAERLELVELEVTSLHNELYK